MNPLTKPPTTLWKTPEVTPLLDEKSSLAILPTEIRDMIVSQVDPRTAYALRQTCRHFYHSLTIASLPKRAVMRWYRGFEMEPQNSELHACFCCFRLKPPRAFMWAQIHNHMLEKGASHAHRRLCMDCCVTHGIILYRDVVKEATPESSLLVLCYGCKKFCADFCWICRLCRPCVKVEVCKKKEFGRANDKVIRVPHNFDWARER